MPLGNTSPTVSVVYKSDNGTNYKVRMHQDRATSGGFAAANNEPPLPKGMKMRHVDIFLTDGSKRREVCPIAKPDNNAYLNGGTFTYESVAGRVTGRIGEKLRF